MKSLVIALLLCVISAIALNGCPNKPNLNPLIIYEPTFVKQIKNAKLYTTGTAGINKINIVHVWGTPYEMGYAYGQILKDEVYATMNGFYTHLLEETEAYIKDLPKPVQDWIVSIGLDVALGLTYEWTKKFTPEYFFEEIRGVANGSGCDYNKLIKVHMLPELVKAGCTMIGAWGSATPNGELYQLRALDWDTDGPLQKQPTIVVYHPNKGNGHVFANVGWAGWIASITGMSSSPLAISEKVGDKFGRASRVGIPFHYLLRDILQFDNTLDDAINRMINAERTCAVYLGVGDGNLGQFRLFEYTRESLQVFDDQNSPFTPHFKNVVYRGIAQDCLVERIQTLYGNITAENIVRQLVSYTGTGDLHLAVYDFKRMYMYVSNAQVKGSPGPANAYDRQFVGLDMNKIFAISAPVF